MANQPQLLQELFILATGRPANTPNRITLENIVGPDGDLHALDDIINSHMQAQEAALGTTGIVQAVARHALGRTITAEQANNAANDLKAAGLDTWAKIFHWLANDTSEMTTTLDNRGEATVYFTNALEADGKTDLFTGRAIWSAATTLIQTIDSSTQSLANAKDGFDTLADALSVDGIRSAVVDGYVKGATVFIDANDDGRQDDGEWSTITDASGNYTLPENAPVGTIIASGGIDIMTNQPFQGVLTAPSGFPLVNPLTTMVQALVASGQDVADAQTAVTTALGLPATTNPLTYDPLAVFADPDSSDADKAKAFDVQNIALQVANIITQAANAISSSTGSTALIDSGKAVADAIAAAISTAAATGNTVDLTNVSTLTGIINSAATTTAGAGTSVSSSMILQVARIASDSNSETRAANDLAQLAKVAVVTQGDVVDAIKDDAGSGNLNQAVNNFTGTSLSNVINNPGEPTDSESESEPPEDSPNFAVALNATTNIVTFNGNTTDDIDVDVDAALATFSRGSLTATTRVDLTPAGTPTPAPKTLSLGADQTLVVDAEDAQAFIGNDTQFTGAGAIKAQHLSVDQYETLDFSNVATVTVTIADEVDVLAAVNDAAYQAMDARVTDTATIAELNTIDGKWGTVTPTTVGDQLANVSSTTWASSTVDLALTSTDDASISQLKNLDTQWGTVTLASGSIKDSATSILAASAESWVNAAIPAHVTGTVTLSQLASIDDLWGTLTYDKVSGSAADLGDADGKYVAASINVIVTDGATISQLQQINNLWGEVTYTHIRDSASTIAGNINYVESNMLVTLTDVSVSLNDLVTVERETTVAIDASAVQTITGDSNAIWEFYDNALFFGNWVTGLGDEAFILDNTKLSRSSITNLDAITTGAIDIGGIGDLWDSFSNIVAIVLDNASVVGIENLTRVVIEDVGEINATMLDQLLAIDEATGNAQIELLGISGINGPVMAVNAALASLDLTGIANVPATLTDATAMTVAQFDSAYASLGDDDTVHIFDTSANIEAALANLKARVAKIAGINSTENSTPISMDVAEFVALHSLLEASDRIHVTGTSSHLGFSFSTLKDAAGKLDVIDSTEDGTSISIDFNYFSVLGSKLVAGDTVLFSDTSDNITAALGDLVTYVANVDAIKSSQPGEAIVMDVAQFIALSGKLDADDTIHVNDTAVNIGANLDALASNAANLDVLDSTSPDAGISYTFAQFVALEHALLTSDSIVLDDTPGNLDGANLSFSGKLDHVLAQGVATFDVQVPHDEVDAPGEWAFNRDADTGTLIWWSGDADSGQPVTITLAGQVASVTPYENFLSLEYGTFS